MRPNRPQDTPTALAQSTDPNKQLTLPIHILFKMPPNTSYSQTTLPAIAALQQYPQSNEKRLIDSTWPKKRAATQISTRRTFPEKKEIKICSYYYKTRKLDILNITNAMSKHCNKHILMNFHSFK